MTRDKIRAVATVSAAALAVVVVLVVGFATALGMILTGVILGLLLSMVVGLVIREDAVDKSLKELGFPLSFTELCMWIAGVTSAVLTLVQHLF